ncbi:MAG: hypothetical protein U0V73_06810 [Acidimicrobiia bacterium]
MDIRRYSDITDFYDADPRRRESKELEFGNQWHDAAGYRYKLSWVEDTGELYLLNLGGEIGSADVLGELLLRGF